VVSHVAAMDTRQYQRRPGAAPTISSLPSWTSERPSSEVVGSWFLWFDQSDGAVLSWSLSWPVVTWCQVMDPSAILRDMRHLIFSM
jgi:hypothetical protein